MHTYIHQGIAVNAAAAPQVSKHGARFVLSELDPEGVERWVDQKKATVAARLIAQEMRARRTGK
jgi:hypothetical protein